MKPDPSFEFPVRTAGEHAADAVVHAIGVIAGLIGASWLLVVTAGHVSATEMVSLAAYGAGLVGMLSASAAYNLAPPGRRKAVLRRIDHAMIYVMIAGSYTPFTLNRLDGAAGIPLGVAVWVVALGGVALKLFASWRYERLGFVLYLGLGWAILSVAEPLWRSLAPETLLLLSVGGVVYTVGAFIHTMDRLPYNIPVWHALVVIAASCHFAAVAREFVVT
ncbi:PAQR family membrane homeostasis protein TrhA [Roseomonas genomospecies 6]|uniref:Hemolysin III family protein n=1 Tax=Roseomonas genomospecies 6 TaxID=214106 RepID=A0A9W7NF64_9PROT|nr:hemolysin III family protein [Roseomonas genomospecies 6]KAA0676551.1 hemolysin III family protein [Roseomonas genomospecies 6]